MTRRTDALAIVLALVAPAAATAQFSPAEYAQRRGALLAQIPDGIVVALGAREPAQDYLSLYQSPSFSYLTGFLEPNATLVTVKSAGQVTNTLFVEPRVPAREVWVGMRLGVDGAQRRTGLPTRDIADLPHVLDSLVATPLPWYFIGELETEDGSSLTPDQQFVSLFHSLHPT